MGKKRKSRPLDSGPKGPREVDPADANLGRISTYEDIADSEEEFLMNQDKILFDDEPKSKRRKQQDEQEAFLEVSDEEVLDYGDDSDDNVTASKPRRAARPFKKAQVSEDEEQAEDDEEGDEGWWGSSRKEYYDADNIETEEAAKEEEEEAKRLQKKKLAKMAEEDFIFDEAEWAGQQEPEKEEHEVVTEVLERMQVTEDMGPEERYTLLQTKYPEFEHLVNEFVTLQPLLPVLQGHARGRPAQSVEAVKYWVLGSYVAALASYFAILTSPARDSEGSNATLDPAELREHDVMQTLVNCKETWQQVRRLKSAVRIDALDSPLPDFDDAFLPAAAEGPIKKPKAKKDKAAKDKAALKKKRAADVEASMADLKQARPISNKPKSKAVSNKPTLGANEDDHSDFGEEEVLDARTAAEKAARKKSLRFYTSQIAQKSNRCTEAGRSVGGDSDIPYRERFRDRQARLNAQAEKRGQRDSKVGADLDPNASEDENEAAMANGQRANEDDEYYDMVAAASKKKKVQKAAYNEALAKAAVTDRVVEVEEIGEDGKRQVTYAIEKNKGLAPKRKKENRNPRVKKKMQFERKQKKLRTMKATFKGGEGPGGYGGELTGIKSGLIRARKL